MKYLSTFNLYSFPASFGGCRLSTASSLGNQSESPVRTSLKWRGCKASPADWSFLSTCVCIAWVPGRCVAHVYVQIHSDNLRKLENVGEQYPFLSKDPFMAYSHQSSMMINLWGRTSSPYKSQRFTKQLAKDKRINDDPTCFSRSSPISLWNPRAPRLL